MNVGACAAVACSALVLGRKRDQERLKKPNMFIQKRLYTQQSHLIITASFLNLRDVACVGEKQGSFIATPRMLEVFQKKYGSDQRRDEG